MRQVMHSTNEWATCRLTVVLSQLDLIQSYAAACVSINSIYHFHHKLNGTLTITLLSTTWSTHTHYTYHVNGDFSDFGVAMLLAEGLYSFDFSGDLGSQNLLKVRFFTGQIAHGCCKDRQGLLLTEIKAFNMISISVVTTRFLIFWNYFKHASKRLLYYFHMRKTTLNSMYLFTESLLWWKLDLNLFQYLSEKLYLKHTYKYNVHKNIFFSLANHCNI